MSDSSRPLDGRALKGQRGLRRILNALGYSIDGFRAAWQQEHAFRQEVVLAGVLLPVAILAPVTAVERLLLIGTLLLVIIVELLNTAIESAIDRQSYEIHRLAKQAKDFGSAAVLIALVFAALTWASVLIPLVAR